MVFSVWVLTILNTAGLRSPGMEGECSTTKRVNHGCMSPPQKKTTTQGLNDCCWWKHHACALNPTVSKIPLPFFHFTIFHPPPPTPERHPEISSHAIPLCHGVPKPLQWWFTWKQWDNHLYNDFKWTGGLRTGKKNAFGYPEIGIEIQSSTTYFFGEGGRGEARVMFCSGQNPFRDLEVP